MKAPTRLGLYGLFLVIVFGVAAVTANAIVPEETVQRWIQEVEETDHTGGAHSGETEDAHSSETNDTDTETETETDEHDEGEDHDG